MEIAPQIHINHGLVFIRCDVGEARAENDPGIVDENIDLIEIPHNVGYRAFALITLRHITGISTVFARNLGRLSGGIIGFKVKQRDVGAVRRKQARRRPTNSLRRRRASDNSDFAFQVNVIIHE